MEQEIKQDSRIRIFFLGLWKFILAVMILFGVIIFPIMGVLSNPQSSNALTATGSSSVVFVSWLLLLIIILWYPIALTIWVVKDARKFKKQGVRIMPLLWGMGMILPIGIFIITFIYKIYVPRSIGVTFLIFSLIFSSYFVLRSVSWRRKIRTNNLDIIEQEIKPEQEIRKMYVPSKRVRNVSLSVIAIAFIGYPILIYLAQYNRPIAKFLTAIHSVIYSQSSCGVEKKGCDELRALPKVLQNKKIVFSKDINIEFDPYESWKEAVESGTVGFLDTDSGKLSNEFVDPALQKRGYVAEREYKIVRAVYHYNCSYCIDSSDNAYVVLQDSAGNRFTALLDDLSDIPGRDIPWDEQLPFLLDKRNADKWELKDTN